MSGVDFLKAGAALIQDGAVTGDELLQLRAHVFGDGTVSTSDVELLFKINGSPAGLDSEWERLFSQTLTDYLVHQVEPHGYVSGANAGWVVGQFRAAATVRRWSDIAAVTAVMEAAARAPETLVAFALHSLQDAILEPGCIGRPGEVGVIGAADVGMIRRVLFAFGGDGAIAVTQTEAGFLFDLNDQTDQAANHPEWSDLFVKAIANFLMKANGYQVPSRAKALHREAWLNARPDAGATLAAMLSVNLKNIWSAYRQNPPLTRLSTEAESIEDAARIDADEARWLAERIGRNAALHDNEKALLRFIAEESPGIHPALQTVIDTAA